MMRHQEEGWHSIPEKYVCADCFHDYAINPCADEMDEVLSFILHGLDREYEDPVHHVGYDSLEGGYLLPVTLTWDFFCDLGFGNGPSELFDDLVGSFSDCSWVQKGPYGSLQCNEWRLHKG